MKPTLKFEAGTTGIGIAEVLEEAGLDLVVQRPGAGLFLDRENTGVAGGAVAKVPAMRLWRGFAVAGALHLAAVLLVLLVLKARMPGAPPDGPVITVAVETTPQGATASAAMPARAVPLPEVPQPVEAAAAPRAVRSVSARRDAHPALLARGAKMPGAKSGNVEVAATRPARPDAGSTVYYSELARQLGEQGEVRLRIMVSPGGAPRQVMVEKSSGFWRLDDDARASALTWHFQPALRHGVRVASVLSYWIRFQLQ